MFKVVIGSYITFTCILIFYDMLPYSFAIYFFHSRPIRIDKKHGSFNA